jgi:hypothetical protein
MSFHQTESPRYAVKLFSRLKAWVIVNFEFGGVDVLHKAKCVPRIKLPQYAITQAFSLQSFLQATWGVAPGCYNSDFQSDKKSSLELCNYLFRSFFLVLAYDRD